MEDEFDEENLDQNHEEKKDDEEQIQEIKEQNDENEQVQDNEEKNEIKIQQQDENEEQNENIIEEEQIDENKIIEEEKKEEKLENDEKNDEQEEGEEIKKINIYISRTSEVGGKTLYHIKGDFIPQDKEIIRRYRDFDLLHKKLSNNWPCVFIPPISPKKYFISSSTDKETVKERLFQLENFLKMCTNYPYIFGAPEMKLFLSLEITTSDKLQTMMKKLPSYGYKKISEIYTLLFSKHKKMKKVDLTDEKLSTYVEYITAFITKLGEYKKQLVILGDIPKDNIYRENKLIGQFIDFEKRGISNFINKDMSLLFFYDEQNSLKKSNEKYDKAIIQPYLILSGWIQLKELELNAIKEKLNEYKEYINKKKSYNTKLKEMEEKSHSIKEGRVSFLDKIFARGDIGRLQENHDKDLENHRAETNYLNTIVDIAGDYISVEYNKYFAYLTKNFYYIVRNFANTQKENSIAASELWKQIKNGKEGKEIKEGNTEKNNEIINEK